MYAGHIFPLRAVKGGVLARDGHTEATVDLARMAGYPPVALNPQPQTPEPNLKTLNPKPEIIARYPPCP